MSTVGRSRRSAPSSRSLAPSTSRKSLAPSTSTRIAGGTLSAPGTREGLERHMFRDVTVIGAGRAGTAIAARLRERGVAVRDDAELRLLCVPDAAIAGAARAIEPGPWVAHVSGATPLAALEPHARRLRVPPLQTVTRAPVRPPSAADVHPRARAGAARRSLRRRHRRDGRGGRARLLARPVARPG